MGSLQSYNGTISTTPEKPLYWGFYRIGIHPGQYADEETGLHWNWHRFYDPGVGRYVESDPIGLKGGINLFSYTKSNPLRFIDPLGLFVVGTYNRATGQLVVYDQDTGQRVSIQAESGGKPFGDPIPLGTYDMLERNGRPDFYRLDKQDQTPYDDVDDATGRDHFRLHRPGRTTGCVSAKDWDEWRKLDNLIRTTRRTDQVPDHYKPWWKIWPTKQGYLKRYGTITVY